MPPIIDSDLCSCCGACVEICTEDVFYGSEDGAVPTVTFPDECVHFSGCVYECPEEAITLRLPLPMLLVYRPTPAGR